MDSRQLVAAKRDLLVISLSPDSLDFLYYLLEKHQIDYITITNHKELLTSITKIDDLISVICKRPTTDLADEFLRWLLETEQNDLHRTITNGQAIKSSVIVDQSLYALSSDSVVVDDGESDCESLSRETTPLLEMRHVLPTQEYMDEKLESKGTVYPLSSPIRGIAMLIVNSKFHATPAFSRDGSDIDTNNLSELFTWLGYQVLVYSNVSSKDLIAKLNGLVRDKQQRSYSSFVLCILSRGSIGSITMSDLSKIYTDELQDRLDSNNFPAMAGKPKFIFIDSNNKELSDDHGLVLPQDGHKFGVTRSLEPIQIIQSPTVRSESKVRHVEMSAPVLDEHCTKVACKADFVIFLASFPGYTALHNKSIGSLSTRVLVETFYKHAHKYHVTELAMKIRRKRGSKFLAKTTEMLTVVDTLTKDFYMFPPLQQI